MAMHKKSKKPAARTPRAATPRKPKPVGKRPTRQGATRNAFGQATAAAAKAKKPGRTKRGY